MLYPDFNELVAFKDRKAISVHPSGRTVKSTTPGNHHSPFRGQGLEFDAVREYIPGDDIRRIDWRVTARTGSPHLKVFKEERERHLTLCIDMNATMRFGTRNTFKSVQAARAAALLGWQGIAGHDCVGACLFGDVSGGIQFFTPKRTGKSFCNMLKTLAQTPVNSHDISMNDALLHLSKAAHTGSLLYFISDFMDFHENSIHQGALSQLNKRCDVVFIAINDRADQSIAPVGTLRLCTNNGNKIIVNTDSMTGREAYAALWKKNRQRLYEITSTFKIPLIELTTESEIRRDLVLGLKSVSKRKRQ